MSELPTEFAYQEHVRKKILTRGKTAVIAVPGAGKTRPIIDALEELVLLGSSAMDPVLILCSGPATATWVRQIPLWCGDSTMASRIYVCRGTPAQRRKILAHAREQGGIVITNSAVFLRDFHVISAMHWSALVADEYHKYMRRRKSQTYIRFLKLSRETQIVVLATGSIISRDPSSMFTAFQIVDPKYFSSYWKFVNTFCLVDETPFGKQIMGPKNLAALRETMDRYLAYIPEEVIADQLPQGSRQAADVEMTPEQATVYEQLAKEMYVELKAGGLVVAPNAITLLVRLRQLLCCPRAVDSSLGMGGGYYWMLEQFGWGEADAQHPYCVVFAPFRDACQCIHDDLKFLGYTVGMIRGGMDHEEVRATVDMFRGKVDEGMILVCTISFAESFDLEKCSTSYFLGYDYDLNQNQQAEGRTRRAISEHKFVRWTYIKYVGTIDEVMLQKLNEDFCNVKRVLSRPQELIDALKGVSKNN